MLDEPRSDVAGWDVLLRAYLSEFARAERVCLVLLTQHSDGGAADVVINSGGTQRWAEQQLQKFVSDFAQESATVASTLNSSNASAVLPRIVLVGRRLPRRDMPRFYAHGMNGRGAFISARCVAIYRLALLHYNIVTHQSIR